MTEYKYKVSDFEGPLDLLLYLIEKNKVDIYNIPIVEITDQFNAYVADIDTFDVDYASKFFVMAATLLQIKSRLLLPKPKNISAAEADPKQDLIERLENYLRIKQAAERLGQMSVLERDTFAANISLGHVIQSNDGYSADALRDAMLCVFSRPEPAVHQILQEPVLLEERIAYIESRLESGAVLEFAALLKPSQIGRAHV